MTVRRWLVVALLASAVGACGGSPTAGERESDDQAPAEPGSTLTVDVDDRPFQLHVPESYDRTTSLPLVVLLHGYTSSADEQESYFQLTAESDRRGFLYAMPDGTTDPRGEQFWNATDACCDFSGSGVDDSAYLRRMIDELVSSYPVDTARVYLVGHSNGGFMAHRMACDHSTVITAIVSLAGMAPHEPSECAPERPVSVLQIHGTADATIPYDGGANAGRRFPSVADTLAMWRGHNGCAEQADESAEPLDLDADLPGAETAVTTYADGCRDGTRVELWSIQDGGHVPSLSSAFAPAVVDFLYAQSPQR